MLEKICHRKCFVLSRALLFTEKAVAHIHTFSFLYERCIAVYGCVFMSCLLYAHDYATQLLVLRLIKCHSLTLSLSSDRIFHNNCYPQVNTACSVNIPISQLPFFKFSSMLIGFDVVINSFKNEFSVYTTHTLT
jgi:hypothetical protein